MTILDIAATVALFLAVFVNAFVFMFCTLGIVVIVFEFFENRREAHRRFIARRVADAVKQIDPEAPRAQVCGHDDGVASSQVYKDIIGVGNDRSPQSRQHWDPRLPYTSFLTTDRRRKPT